MDPDWINGIIGARACRLDLAEDAVGAAFEYAWCDHIRRFALGKKMHNANKCRVFTFDPTLPKESKSMVQFFKPRDANNDDTFKNVLSSIDLKTSQAIIEVLRSPGPSRFLVLRPQWWPRDQRETEVMITLTEKNSVAWDGKKKLVDVVSNSKFDIADSVYVCSYILRVHYTPYSEHSQHIRDIVRTTYSPKPSASDVDSNQIASSRAGECQLIAIVGLRETSSSSSSSSLGGSGSSGNTRRTYSVMATGVTPFLHGRGLNYNGVRFGLNDAGVSFLLYYFHVDEAARDRLYLVD